MIIPIYSKINQILLPPPLPPPPPILCPNCRSRSVWQRPFRLRCHSMRSDYGGSGDRYANGEGRPHETPAMISVAVSGVTELLKVFSLPKVETERLSDAEEFENSTSSVDDVVRILKSDYEKDYLATSESLPPIYPPSKVTAYTGQFDVLYKILAWLNQHGEDAGKRFILAKWKLRTYLRFSWRPLILIDGSTAYDLNDNFEVIGHAESWGVSALQAIGQIFTPRFGKSDG